MPNLSALTSSASLAPHPPSLSRRFHVAFMSIHGRFHVGLVSVLSRFHVAFLSLFYPLLAPPFPQTPLLKSLARTSHPPKHLFPPPRPQTQFPPATNPLHLNPKSPQPKSNSPQDSRP